jgi:type IV pilus assembly protein PilY1
MKPLHTKALILSAGLLFSAAATAEDIDLFQGGSSTSTNKPNVLIIVDNSANWNSGSQHWPGGIKQGQSELNALNYVMNSNLVKGAKVGLMMFVKGQGGSQMDGGYVRFGIRDMADTTANSAFRTILTNMYPVFNSENSGQQVASANTAYGEVMYEAYRYFGGGTPYAGPGASNLRDYPGNGNPQTSPYTAGSIDGHALASSSTSASYNSPLSADSPCAKNFIIFIGNGFPSSASLNPVTGYNDSSLAQFDATQIYPEGTKTTYADEWSRFLKQKGVVAPCKGSGASQVCADGKIVTYTIDVYKDAQDLPETNLLKSMATVGGGSYCHASSEAEIRTCLSNAFNDIQAVNSVFTSSSLPVSVNTQGTYLNQIYMGMFRPDGKGKPRWPGNLKEYKLGLTTSPAGVDSLFLSDADGNPAINSNTGFIKPTARSFWTYSNSPADGFWKFNPQGEGGPYDSPDGDLVEKGGAAQQLRDLGPTNRRVYTCPTAGCTSGAAMTSFVATDTALVAQVKASDKIFNSGLAASFTRAGPTVTGTVTSGTSNALGLDFPTDVVSITGASVADYNGVWTVNYPGTGNTFTFTMPETPATPATTSTALTVASGATTSQTIQTSPSSGNVTYNNGTVTVNLPSHGFANNQQITISGADVSALMAQTTTAQDGTATNSASTQVGSGTTTTISDVTSSPSVSGNTTTTTETIIKATATTYRVTTSWDTTVFTPCSGYPTSTANCEYNGTYNITYVDADHFTYTPPTANYGKTTTTTKSYYTDTIKYTNAKRTVITTTTTVVPGVDSTSYSPPQTFVTSYGTANFACKSGGGNVSYTPSITSMTRITAGDPTPAVPARGATTTATGTKTVTIKVAKADVGASCNVPFTSGNGNKDLQSFSISSSNGANAINSTYTLASSAITDANTTITVTFNVTVTATRTWPNDTSSTSSDSPGVTTSYSTSISDSVGSPSATTAASSTDQTLIPASTATGTIVAIGQPTKVVSSISRTDGNASNVATVTVTTASAHGFSGQTSVTIAGADQTEYNGVKTTTSDNLQFPSSNTITFNLTTGPAASATGAAAKGYSIDPTSLINWVRGVDNKEDENANQSYTDVRASVHGDALHSRPVVVNYGGNDVNNPLLVAYYGANDGTMHAVKVGQSTGSGQEKWAFVAPEHFPTIGRIYNNLPLIKFPNTDTSVTPTPTKRDYFFDGNIGVYQSADLLTTHIFVSARRGGRFIYAFDVSDPDNPKYLWKKGCPSVANNDNCDSGFSATDWSIGQTWSEPKVILMKKTAGVACNSGNPDTYVRALVFGGGYDPWRDDQGNDSSGKPVMGNAVFVLNAADGSILKVFHPSGAKRFTADVSLIDTDGDGCIDRLYGVDTGANIFRFDVGDPSAANWLTYQIASLGGTGASDRRFLYRPDVVISYVNNAQVAYLLVGSGDREDPLTSTVQNYFFMIKDMVATGTATALAPSPTAFSDLTKVISFDSTSASALTATAVDADNFKGWYIQYDSGEKSVNAALTVAGVTYFGTNLPKAATAQCIPNLGTARGYAINFLTGTAANQNLYTNFTNGGFPPSPVTGTTIICDENGNNCKVEQFLIGGGDSSTNSDSSAYDAVKVKGAPNSSRTRVYWYFKKDQ